jgi:hypothetical protein
MIEQKEREPRTWGTYTPPTYTPPTYTPPPERWSRGLVVSLVAAGVAAAVGVVGMLLSCGSPSADRRTGAAPTALQRWVPA